MNTEKKLTAKEIRLLIDGFSGKPQTEVSTEMLCTIREAAGKIAYVAIRTLYAKEATPYFLKLLYQSLFTFEKANNQLFKEAIENEKGFSHDFQKTKRKKLLSFVNPDETKAVYRSDRELTDDEIHLLSMDYDEVYRQTLELIDVRDEKAGKAANRFLKISEELPALLDKIEKEENRTMNPGNVKKMFVPIRPKTESKVTESGKLYDEETANAKAFTSDEFQDVVSEAFIALWECYRARLFSDSGNIWNVSKYAYAKVNTFVRSNRKVYNQTNTYTAFITGTDKNGTYYEKHIEDKRAKSELNKIEESELIEEIKTFLFENLDKRSNKQNIIAAFTLCFYGYSQQKIAEKLAVNQQMVSKYISYAKNALQSEKGNMLLQSIIENR